ncbi:MAG: energy-coupling factor ABC transporter permease [Planctomycetes bacterium]|nr:energy-coupling factor ABC transporter permease [Planctomycetota bacterium]
MHLPDGVLSPAVWIAAAGASGASLALALRETRSATRGIARSPGETGSPAGIGTTATLAAFVFAAQSFQIPIPGGASAHLLGGSLLTAALGPARAVCAMASVFAVQALAFHDGGIAALGANLWNGGIVPSAVTSAMIAFMPPRSTSRMRALMAGGGAVLGVFLGSLFCAFEIGLSGAAALPVALAAIAGIHLWVALVEGVLTAALVGALFGARQFTADPGAGRGSARLSLPILVASAALATAIAASQFSAGSPDGLERASAQLGISATAPEPEREELGGAVPTLAGASLAAVALAIGIAWRRPASSAP